MNGLEADCGVLVLADDLTGAADAAVALARHALTAEVVLHADGVAHAGADVVALDLDTRRMTARMAARTVAHAVAVTATSRRRLFKKIDSTLRGHIGAELAALARSMPARADSTRVLYLVASAHPDLGRTMIQGELMVRGELVPEGISLSRDLEAHGFVCRLLPQTLLDSCTETALRERVEAAAVPARAALICDSQSMDDLRRIAAAASATAIDCVWVGSGGLALALADVLHRGKRDSSEGWQTLDDSRPRSPGQRDRPIALVVGSYSNVAHAHVRQLVTAGDIQVIALDPRKEASRSEAEAAARVDAAVSSNRDVVIYIESGLVVRPELSAALARRLASTIAPQLSRLAGLIVCGGETSRALLDFVGVRHLSLEASAELGATRATTPSYPDLALVLKAGAFGNRDVLLRLRQQLKLNGPFNRTRAPSQGCS